MIRTLPDRLKDIRIFSQNVNRNYLHVDTLLETLKYDFDILFIQEPPWRVIRQAPSPSNPDGEDVIGAPKHPDWTYMVRPPQRNLNPRVMAYVSTRLSKLRPSLRRDLVDHRDIMFVSLFSGQDVINLLNVYNNGDNTAVHFLRQEMDNLPTCEYMGGDFNCHSEVWDPDVPHHRASAQALVDMASDLNLAWTPLSNPGDTHYPHDGSLNPSVIDLVFLPSVPEQEYLPGRATDLRGPS